MAILRHSTTEKNNEYESVCNSSRQLANPNYKKAGAKPPIKPKSSQGVGVPGVSSQQIKKEAFNDNLQPFSVQKPAVKNQVKSKSVDTSKAQSAKPNYKLAGTKPPIKPKPSIKPKPQLDTEDEEYVYMEEEMGFYEPLNIMPNPANKLMTL